MMSRLSALGRLWVDVTSDREPPCVLAAFRIAIGVVLLGSLASAAASGVVETLWVDASDGGALRLEPSPWLVALLGGPTRRVIWSLFAIAGAAGTLVTLGLGGRLPYLLAAQAYGALTHTNTDTVGAYDSMLTNALYLLFFSAASATYSLSCRLSNGAWTSHENEPAWPRYLLLFQLLLIYAATGLQKMSLPWTPLGGYSALYWVLQDPTWRRFDMAWTASVYPLLQVATATTWHWELAAPILLLYFYAKRTAPVGGRWRALLTRCDLRKPYALIGIGLHLGILVLLNVGPFSIVSLAYYLLLLRPDELTALLSRTRSAQPFAH